MEVQHNVPFSVEDITPSWIATSLQSSGLLVSGSVTDIDVKVLGEQVGFNGEVAIITPTYSAPSDKAPSDKAPASMVLKIPTASKNRILGQTMGLYEKEIRFYRDLQAGLNIRTPRHYYSALDIADDPDVILERLQGMNRLPLWMLRIIMALATRFVAGHPRKYALLIEDLSSYRMGNQVTGCSDDDIHNIIKTMARLHAQYWNSDKLAAMSWVAPYAVTSRIMQMRFLQTIDRYLAEEGARLTSHQREMLAWLRGNGIALTEAYGASTPTLLHGDFRLDNICFDKTTGEVVLFDWQTMQAGPGASDLAYFISATLPVDTDERRIKELIDLYHTELNQQGVVVNREELRQQYDIGMLNILQRILPTAYDETQMDLDAERGLPLLKAWISKIWARLEHFDDHTALERYVKPPV